MNLNTELTQKETPLFLQYCNALGVKYETCGVFNLTHITVFNLTPEQREKLDLFIERLEELERSVKRG